MEGIKRGTSPFLGPTSQEFFSSVCTIYAKIYVQHNFRRKYFGKSKAEPSMLFLCLMEISGGLEWEEGGAEGKGENMSYMVANMVAYFMNSKMHLF